jgi:hypothetical protein
LDKNNYKHLDGQIHLTVGTAGVGLGDVNPDNNFIARVRGLTGPADSYYVVKTEDKYYGFLELGFSSDGSSLRGTFYGNNGRSDPVVMDQFTVSK